MDETYIGGGVTLLLILMSVWVTFSRRNRREVGSIGYVLGLFFLFRGVLCIVNFLYEILPLQMDAMVYDEYGKMIADLIKQEGVRGVLDLDALSYAVEPGYTVILGVFYWLFGSSALVGYILNTFVFTLTSYNVYRIGAILFSSRAGSVGAIVYNVLPYSALDSTYLHRDPLVNYFLSEFFVSLLVVLGGKGAPAHYARLGFATLYGGVLRRENLVIESVILCGVALSKLQSQKDILKPIRLTLALIVLVCSLYAGFGNSDKWLLRSYGQLSKVEAMQERIESLDPESSYLVGQTYNSFSDLVKYAPLRALYFLFSPFPWQFFKASQYVAFGETLIVGFALLFIPKALYGILRKHKEYFVALLIFLVGGILGAGVIQSNSAGAQRHRTQFSFLIVAIGVAYVAQGRGTTERVYEMKSYGRVQRVTGTGGVDRRCGTRRRFVRVRPDARRRISI